MIITTQEYITNKINYLHFDLVANSDIFTDLNGKLKISYNPHYDTASWRFENPNVHHMVIGNIFGKESVDQNNIDSKEIENYFFHELAHAHYTTKDMKKLGKKLEKNEIPFETFNLFEDAKIEYLWCKNFNYKFNWSEYEEFEATDPYEVFFKIIQTSNDHSKFVMYRERKFYQIVLPFYEEAIKTKNDDELIDVIRQFQTLFGQEKPKKKGNKENKNDSKESSKDTNQLKNGNRGEGVSIKYTDSELSDEQDNKKEIFKNVDNVVIIGDEGLLPTKEKNLLIELNEYEGTTSYMAQNIINKKNVKLIGHIIDIMKRVFKSNKYKIQNHKGKRIDPLRMVLNHDKVFVNSMEIKNKQKIQLTLIIDNSGSMKLVEEETINILHALNSLTSQGFLDVTILLSGSFGYQKIRLPVKDEYINSIVLGSGRYEAIEETMKQNLHLLQNSNNVIVLSDGMVPDRPIDKKYFNDKGVKTLAIYIVNDKVEVISQRELINNDVAEPADINLLTLWYDDVILKRSVISVINGIVERGFKS